MAQAMAHSAMARRKERPGTASTKEKEEANLAAIKSTNIDGSPVIYANVKTETPNLGTQVLTFEALRATETTAIHGVLGNTMLQLHSINDRLEDLERTPVTPPTDASSSTPPQVYGLPKSGLQSLPIMQKHPSATPFSKGTFTSPSAVHPRIHGDALPAKATEVKEAPLKVKLRRFPGQGQ